MPESPSLVLSLPSVPTATIALTSTPYTTFGASSAGVSSINGQLGSLILSGAGSVYVTNDGRLIIVSGSATAGGGLTGAVTQADLAATGTVLNIKIDSLSGWASNALTQTGATLIGLINGLGAGGVTSVNSATGAVLLTGAGSVSITRNGSTFTISGLVSGGGAGDVTFNQLTATGSYLEGLITGQSGFSAATYATKEQLTNTGVTLNSQLVSISNNLASTGSTLDSKINSLSGSSSSIYATKVDLATTGTDLFNRDVSISGGLESRISITGQQAWTTADNNGRNLSGNLTQTGVSLGARIASTESDLLANAVNLSGRLTQTGSQLYSMAAAISGNLTQTGVNLGNQINTVSSNTTANATNLSGRLATTGSQLYSMAASISGNLIQTGVSLGLRIGSAETNAQANATNISGRLTATGQLLTALTVTGSNILNSANLVGLGGTQVIHSGNNVYISGAQGGVTASQLESTGQQAWTAADNNARNISGRLTETGAILISLINAASAGVSSINGASGVLTINGAGNVSVTTAGQTITVSGDTGAYTSFATKVDLTQTGVSLGSRIDLAISDSTANANNLSGRLTATGSQLYSFTATVSGNLTQTGVALGSRIDGITSDSIANALNLSGRLAATGSQLYSFSATISGNLIQTGVSLGSRITTVETNTAANATNLSGRLAATGSQLYSFAASNSGDLIQTGVTLGSQINTVATNTAANATNLSGRLATTGSQLHSMAASISGNLTQTGVSLGGRIDTVASNTAANASNLSGNLTTTGSQLYSFAATISGNLTQTGVSLGSRIGTVETNTQANATNLSGRLTQTGVLLGSRIDTAEANTQANAVNISGNLTQTGVLLGGRIDTLTTNVAANANNLSGRLTATGQLLSALSVTGSNTVNNPILSGLGGTLVILSGDRIVLVSGAGGGISALQLESTGQAAWTAADNNARNLSGNLSTTGNILWERDLSISGALSAQIGAANAGVTSVNGLTGVVTVAGAGQTSVTTAGSTITVSGIAPSSGILSPAFVQASGTHVTLTIDPLKASQKLNLLATGANVVLSLANPFNGAQGMVLVTKYYTGASTITLAADNKIINNLSSTVVNLSSGTGVWDVMSFVHDGVRPFWAVSTLTGAASTSSSGLSIPSFNVQSGSSVTLTIDSSKTFQPLKIIATGGNINLSISNAFNGANGIVLVDKRFAGEASLYIPSNSYIINGGGVTGLRLSSGISGIDAFSFVYDSSTAYWVASNISGGSSVGDVTASQLASTGQAAWTAADNNARNLSGNLTQTGVLLGGRIDTANNNITANATNLSGNLGVTGSQLYSMTATISGNLTQTGVTLGLRITSVETNTQANATNLSGRLTQTGVILGSRIDTVETNTQANAVNLSGNLTQTGVLLGARIDTLTSNVSANATNLSGNLTTTGNVLWQRDLDISGALAAQIGAASAGVTSVNGVTGLVTIAGAGLNTVTTAGQTITVSGAIPPSGVLSPAFIQASGENIVLTVDPTKTAQRLNIIATGAVNINLTVTGGYNGANGSVLVTKTYGGPGNIILQSDSRIINNLSSNVVALSTGSGVWDVMSFLHDGTRPYWAVSSLSGSSVGVTASQLASTGQQAWIAADNNARNLSGNLTQTGVSLGARIDTLTSNVTVNANNLSGNLTQTGISLGARIDTLTTNVAANAANLSGNLTQTGVALITRDLLISGALTTGMSPAFVSISGTSITITASQSKASQQYKLLATGNNTTLTINNAYNGCNGIIIVDKSFAGTGALILPANAVVINGGGINAIPYSTGTGYDVFSFIHDESRSYWVANSLSGSSSASTVGQGGTGTFVSITGSTNLNNTTITGVGTVSVSLIGTTTIISGTAGAGGGTSLNVTGSSTLSSATLSGIGGTRIILSGNNLILVSGASSSGPAAPVAGSDEEIIFNNNGVYSGDPDLHWHYSSGSLNIGNAVILIDNPLAISKSGSYVQANIQNKSSANNASSDWIATANNGNDSINYIDVGINGSAYSQTGYSITKPNDGYLYTNGGDLVIGTQTSGKQLIVHVGGTTSGNQVFTVNSSGINLESGDAIQFGSSLRLNQESYAGKEVLSIMQSGMMSAGYIMGPALWSKQFTAILPATTTSQTILGNTLANAAGTVSTVSDQIFGQFTNYVTAAPAGSAAGTSVTTPYYLRGTITGKNGFFFTCQFALTDGTTPTNAYGNPSGSRLFIGMTDQAALATVALNDPAGNRVGLSYAWASGGTSANRFETNWCLTSRNNTTTFTGNMGVAMMSGYYRFSLYAPPFNTQNTGIYWQLDDLIRGSGMVGVIRDNLPIGTTALRPAAVICTISGIKNLKTNNVYVETAG